MKKLTSLLFLTFVSLFVSAQVVEQTYFFDNPVVTEIQSYNQVQLAGCMQTAVEGNPSLPYKAVSLLLPYGSEAESVEVVLSDFEEISVEKQLFPYQASRPYSKPERKQFMKNEDIYSSKSFYPAECHGELTTHYLNGHAFAFTSFTPVKYIPSSGKLMYAKTATVKVKLTSAKKDKSAMLWNTASVNERVKSLADNPEMIDSYKTRGKNVSAYDLLIITGADYVAGFDEYVEYYESIGVRNEIVTTEEIYSSTEGSDNPEKIRNYIVNEYTNNGIIMVLLGGDVNIVPYRGFYCHVQSSSVYEDDGIPADLYFSALDGTWNDNGNNRWGEIGEDDLLPEIGIARMSFNNANKQANMINKTLKYQREPVLGEFRDVTLAGEWLYDNPETWGSDYMELLIGERDDNGYTTIGIPEDYNFTRHYAEDGTWGPNQLRNTINNGTQYVHHVGHANTSTVAEWYNSDITDNNFSGANGVDHNYTFFHSHGCVCGSFDEDCIMERMVTIQNFAVAAIGNSRYGWFNEGQTEGPAPHLHREMTDAQYHERIPFLGMHLSEGKCQTAPFVNAPGQWEEGALRWNFYDLNVLGDVAVRPWLDEPFNPNVDYDEQLFVGMQSTEIVVKDENNVAQKGFRCSIMKDGELLGFGITDEDGAAEISFDGGLTSVGELKLYITGLNAFPLVLDITSVPNDVAYVVYDSYVINDADANNQVDYKETATIDMKFKNFGSVAAGNVTAVLSCETSQYVNITDADAEVGDLNAEGEITLEDAFAFTVCDSVPDGTNVKFFVTCSDGTDTWTSKFSLTLNAPKFEIEILSSSTELNPGENAIIDFKLSNVGNSKAENVTFVAFASEDVMFDQSQVNVAVIEAGTETEVSMPFTLSESAVVGAAYEVQVFAYSGSYITEEICYVVAGNITEDFETGDFTKFDWVLEGNPSWEITTDNVYAGQYSVKSGDVDDMSEATLKIVLDVQSDSEMSFFKKVSSESGYDGLIFSVDGDKVSEWSGEVDWSEEKVGLTAGEHTLEWTYTKDYSASNGMDCAFLDNIKFPPTTVILDVETIVENKVKVYPNPAKDFVKVLLNGSNLSVVKIYNVMGLLIDEIDFDSDNVEINISDYVHGVYFFNVDGDVVKVIKN